MVSVRTVASALSVAVIGSLLLAGCATGPEGNANGSPSPSNTVTREPAAVVVSGVDAVDGYFALAVDSCNAALESGVVETNAVTGDKLIMIPKTDAYKDYSAVWVAADGTSEIIFEIDAFSTCGDALTFWMLEEYGEQPSGYEAELSTVEDSTTARVTRDMDGQKYTTMYTAKAGRFVTADVPQWDAPDTAQQWNLVYGVPASDLALLKNAVDAFLKKNQ